MVLVWMRTFCAGRMRSSIPPILLNCINPSLVRVFTIKPTSSMCAASIIFGALGLPFLVAMMFSMRSVLISSA